MFGIGMTELMVIFVIGLLVLGPKRLPELAHSLGKSLAEFRRASNEMRREFMNVAEDVKIDPPNLEPPPQAGVDLAETNPDPAAARPAKPADAHASDPAATAGKPDPAADPADRG